MNRLWNIADLIDLHFFCRMDEEVQHKEGEAVLAKRDRVMYLATIKPQLGKMEDVPPKVLLRKWLTMRRLQYRREKEYEGRMLPGSLWRELSVLCHGLALLLGLMVGAGAAGSLLLYSGTTPLNVSIFFALFVVLQFLMAVGQFCLFLYRRLRRLPMDSTALYLILGRALMRGMDGVRRRLHRGLSGQQRLDLGAILGGIQQHKELAVLVLWPAFILVQLGGIGFNIGVIAATLSKVFFSDMAFAWQSSLQLSPDLVAHLVRWIALPWSWIAPEASPTLAQIQGSQMVLKEGIAHLATADLVAWWPFLCWSVAVYGLAPRCLLLVIGWAKQRHTLEQLPFTALTFRPLLRRMTTPRIDTSGMTEPATSPLALSPAAARDESIRPQARPVLMPTCPAPVTDTQEGLVLIPDELYDDCPLRHLSALLAEKVPGLRIRPQRYDESTPVAAQSTAQITDFLEPPPAELFMLFEAWQPPLRETESFLRALREKCAPRTPISIVLIGKPTSHTMLTPVNPDQLQIWQRKMQALGDANLTVFPLITSTVGTNGQATSAMHIKTSAA